MTGLSVLSFGFSRGLWDGKGAEDFDRLLKYGEHLDAYVLVTNSYKRHRLAPRVLAENVEAIPTDAFGPIHSFWRMLNIGCRVLRARRMTLIQAQDPLFCGLVAMLLGKLFHLPVNVCVYGPNVYDKHWVSSHWLHRILAPVGRWVLRESDGIQVDGGMTARSLIAAGCSPEKVQVKPVVPTNIYDFLAIEREEQSRPTLRLLFVGRFYPQKNVPLMLEAVKDLRARTGQPFELTLVGDGPDEPQLRALVREYGLEEIVHFRGLIPRSAIAAEFAAADIFVLSSNYEGYPRVLMEAAAAALPVVTTAVSGSDEAVADGETGFIVPIGSVAALAEKLAALVDDGELRKRMGIRGRERLREPLEPGKNAPGQIAIWRRIIRPEAVNKRVDSKVPEQRRHLLLFNLATDASHPILGFTSQWIRALAARVDTVDVITMRSGVIDLPANVRVHSVGGEKGYSEPRRALNFYRVLGRLLLEGRVNECFSHMMPEFSGLGGPLLRAAGIPLVTWYAHPNLTLPVKVADFFSNRMVTSLPGAYPYRKDKLSVIGQGIDTELFAPVAKEVEQPDLVLCVGRISRVKNHPVLLRAFAELPGEYRLEILGATTDTADESYAAELRALATELRISDRVTFSPAVPVPELPAHYRRCAVHVNLTPAGFGDKVAWEAMSCGRPCLVANGDFAETLGDRKDELLFKLNDAKDLTQKLRSLLETSTRQREEIGLYLRAQVAQLHSLPRLIERILGELARCGTSHR